MQTDSRWLKFHLGFATALFLVDAFIFDQGAIAAFIALIFILRIFARSYKSSNWRYVSLRAVIYILFSIMTFTARGANNAVAKSRATQLIALVEKYHADHGTWPTRLDDVAQPVPLAKYTLTTNRFNYSLLPQADGPTIEYVELPPYARVYYIFAQKRWGSLD